MQAALPVSPETTTAIVNSLRGAEALHEADVGPSSARGFVAFQGMPQLHASLLGCRNPAGSWSVASSGASGLAEIYRRAQVHPEVISKDSLSVFPISSSGHACLLEAWKGAACIGLKSRAQAQ